MWTFIVPGPRRVGVGYKKKENGDLVAISREDVTRYNRKSVLPIRSYSISLVQ